MDALKKELVKSDRFQSLVSDLKKKHKEQVVIHTYENGNFEYASLDHAFSQIYINFIDFFNKNEIVSVFVEMDSGRLSYLIERKNEELQKLEEAYKKKDVTLKLCERLENKGFLLKGKKEDCKEFVSR